MKSLEQKKNSVYQDKRKTKKNWTLRQNQDQLCKELNQTIVLDSNRQTKMTKERNQSHWKLQQDKIDIEQQRPQLIVRWVQQRWSEIPRQEWEKISQQHQLQDIIQQHKQM